MIDGRKILKVQHVSFCILMAVLVLFHAVPEARCARSQQPLQKELIQARESLRISIARQEKIEADLERLKQSGNASPSIIGDYKQYVDRTKALVRENRKTVHRLEGLQQKYGVGTTGAPPGPSHQHDADLDPEIPEESISDPLADLDRQLDQSLAAFDVALLKEMELIKIQASEKKRDLKDDVEAARQRLKEQGIDVDGESAPEADGEPGDQNPAGGEAAGDESGKPKESGDTMASEENGSTDADGRESGAIENGDMDSGDKRPGDGDGILSKEEERRFGRGEDDDIVARQLREAAQKETDPELRKKLWKEYEAYKNNQ
jgi:hypothetical protein